MNGLTTTIVAGHLTSVITGLAAGKVILSSSVVPVRGERGLGVYEEWAARPENAGKTYTDFINELSLAPPLTENQW